jgi:Domain of unknown function (DUF4139)/N-terminal domain of unknown function (DUF4140)
MHRRLIVRLAATAVVPVALGVGLAVTTLPAQERSPTRTSPEAAPDAAAAKQAEPPARPGVPHAAPSRVTHVTVYQNNALVTRQVDVPDGAGTFELVVTPLPPQTVNGSLYSEGTDGLRVLTTRYRTRPIQEDTREAVRKLEAQLKTLQAEQQQLQGDIQVVEQNTAMLGKLEAFTGANLQHQTEKGALNSEAVLTLSKYVMDGRAEKARELVGLRQKAQDNQDKVQFAQRQLSDLAAGSSKTERDAVIIVDKRKAGPGTVRLNYLVDSASWRPQYKIRAGADKQPIQVEYLAAVIQQTGEDWANAQLVLSTAEPMLNASPPDLKTLEVAVVPRPGPAGQPMAGGGMGLPPAPGMPGQSAGDYVKEAHRLRSQAQREFAGNKPEEGGKIINEAAALEQAKDLLATREEEAKQAREPRASCKEGPTVTYHLPVRLTVPSRNDEQVIEVARIELKPDYFYKALPVLTAHVYRLAIVTNTSAYVLLPGEATMYLGSDFVGRANLPLVAIGEQFTAGFGVDPQLQVVRQMTDKTRTTQGDNQVLKYQYRLLVSSYKTESVRLQLWDRLPHGDAEALSVSLVRSTPEVSTDPLYVREHRPENLLRWDLTVEPGRSGEKALPVTYEFKVELGRQMRIHSITAGTPVGIPLPAEKAAPAPPKAP